MNWDNPAERFALIERVGVAEYNKAHEEHIRQTTVATVAGHAIRRVGSRFGQLFQVEGTERAFKTIQQAEDFARENPVGDGNSLREDLSVVHKMSMNQDPFEKMANNEKVIEVRLHDDKRRQIRCYDEIVFSKLPKSENSLRVRVLSIYRFNTFKELFYTFPSREFGYEGYTLQQMMDMIYTIYSKEQEKEYGVLGIRVRLIDSP